MQRRAETECEREYAMVRECPRSCSTAVALQHRESDSVTIRGGELPFLYRQHLVVEQRSTEREKPTLHK